MYKFIFILYIALGSTLLSAQEVSFQGDTILLTTILDDIKIDGKLDEVAWSNLQVYTDFKMHTPTDGVPASKRTDVKIFASNKALYISAVMYDDDDFVIQTLKRDAFGESDEFGVFLDPINKKSNGYGFGINAFGATSEALVAADGTDESWDNKWKAAIQRGDDGWVAELEIPFKTIRFKENQGDWGINFVRIEPGENEIYVWSPVPRQFDFNDLGYFGTLQWENPPTSKGKNIAIIPYSSASLLKNYDPEMDLDPNLDIGGDVKIGLTTGLNLDLTLNPDFSQVEVDRQVTNLSRFNIFFPERRQFFIENADIFNGYGQFANQPFYSRRIGLDAGGNTVPILYGARLTGNLNNALRIGTFNIHQASSEQSAAQNFSAFTFQQRIGQRSNIKGIFLNRQAYDGSEQISKDYGRNAGAEINLSTNDGKLAGQFGYIHSLKENISDRNQHIYGRFDYSGQNFRTFLFIQNLGRNYFADMGFNARLNNFDPTTGNVERIGYTQIGNMLNYYIYPKKSDIINYHWSGLENFIYVNEGGMLNQWYTRIRHFIFFKNTSQLRFRVNHIFDDLVFPFAITSTPLPAGKYDVWEYNVQFNTDLRKKVNLQAFAVYGGFYNGNKFTYTLDLNLRSQPWGNFSLGLEQNLIRLPQPYGDVDLTLANLRAEINFSTSLFWTTFLQYNTQNDQFNVNTRLQWRYAPMSDIYLVYTDNYLVEGMFGPKNRTIVVKASYWLGL